MTTIVSRPPVLGIFSPGFPRPRARQSSAVPSPSVHRNRPVVDRHLADGDRLGDWPGAGLHTWPPVERLQEVPVGAGHRPLPLVSPLA